MKRLPAVSVLVVVVLCGGWSAAQSHRSESKSFVFIQGNDTVARESFTRSADSLNGDLLLGRTHIHYEGRFASDGTISRLDVRRSDPGTGVAGERLTSAFIGRDSVQLIERLGNNVDTLRLASQPGLLPVINPSIGLFELILADARTQKSETTRIPVLSMDQGAIGAIEVTFVSPDTAAAGFANASKSMRVSVDAQGHIRGGTLGPRRIAVLPTFTPIPPGR